MTRSRNSASPDAPDSPLASAHRLPVPVIRRFHHHTNQPLLEARQSQQYAIKLPGVREKVVPRGAMMRKRPSAASSVQSGRRLRCIRDAEGEREQHHQRSAPPCTAHAKVRRRRVISRYAAPASANNTVVGSGTIANGVMEMNSWPFSLCTSELFKMVAT